MDPIRKEGKEEEEGLIQEVTRDMLREEVNILEIE